MFGIIILVIGVALLLQNLGLVAGSAWSIIWPALLIVFGLALIYRRKHCWCCGGHHKHKEEWHKIGDDMKERFGGHHHHEHWDEEKKEEEPKSE
jgi:predicted tellurium resistance membrane protein TerC